MVSTLAVIMSETFKDFEEATTKAHFRFTSAAVLSIVVSWFNLSTDPKLVAFAFEKVSERHVEVGLFIIAAYLFLTYALRVLDERKILASISEDMLRHKEKIMTSWLNVIDETETAEKALREVKGKISDIDKFLKVKQDFIERIEKLKAQNAKRSNTPEIGRMIENERDHVDAILGNTILTIPANYKLGEKLSEAIVQCKRTLEESKKFKSSLTNKRVFVGVAKFRIILTHYIVPLALGALMIVAFLFGESTDISTLKHESQ